MTTGTVQKAPLPWLWLMVLVAFSGLGTIFVSLVTAGQAWQEHAQAGWPEVTARVDKVGLTPTSTGRRGKLYIRCRLSYAVGFEQNAATVYSRTVPSPEVWQYPPNQIAPFQEWVDEHPKGTPIVVRYDPANPAKVVLVSAYMPNGGPQTPNNVKFLEIVAGTFLVLLTIARITRQRSVAKPALPTTFGKS